MKNTFLLLSPFLLGIIMGQQIIPPEHQLRCRICTNALQLTDCSRVAVCDNRTEECFMDNILTVSYQSVYVGGCRSRQQCNGDPMASVGKKETLYICSSCCSNEDDCNRRVCGIHDNNVSVSQCYHCDSSIMDPRNCVTFSTCDTNEVCFAKSNYVPGSPLTFAYGCQSKYLCKALMTNIFHYLDTCFGNFGKTPECQHESTMCNTCCADGGCNFGTCKEIRDRLYQLYKKGLFSLDTMKTTLKP
ncbi:uncharacterized protein LOC127839335 isoform X1 [Dreissena polymorpha]|nr:uncharacterized protein LOC127839334 [Dreissena polymorpha]XP_052223625.1 uncharacterized protein LOC127839334 [Dreissena polymorpha]XP_052223626.1 uncharacterized protein LOC127839335 isoform X1 [Dreissena polymorpha]XP_052223627.1 uncharacterized protein LOC127839335 isoform X1 [Dreissena polymorpha]XP_052223628.1 uncharacterized protein LOC127839335 isoform X1 [Dreissena polymorpha]KAH3799973.1 hypothetical protein DPMN_153597 [Dreissena polymorpha]